MILIFTYKDDYTADFIINKLNNNKIDYRRFNCEDILQYPITFKFIDEFSYSIMGIKRFDSIWFRRTKLPDLKGISREERLYLYSELESFMKNMFAVIGGKWVSNPDAIYKAENKLFQLRKAQNLGFSIPQTLITNSKDELTQFYFNCDKDIIVKPISKTRIQYSNEPEFIFTNIVTESMIKNLGSFDLTPCIFQRNIKKDYEIRVTVVGNKVFPAAIHSQNDLATMTDWRRKKLQFHEVELPADISKKCIALVAALDLRFGAIDLIKDINGEYIFLEINPNGQWAWIESQTGLPISKAIINELQ